MTTPMTHFHGRWAIAALALGGTLSAPALLSAQDQPTAFVHGYNADSTGWKLLVDNLYNTLAIAPVVPTLTWQRRLPEQRSTLEGRLSGFPMMPAVGHSNGGLITRSYVQMSGANRVDRVLTVNSAHGGSPLAANIVNGRVKNWVVSLADAVVAPLTQFIPNPVFSRGARVAVDLGVFLWTRTSDVLNAPVLHDMVPGSSFIQGLEANRPTEQARTYARVGIGTSVSPAGVFCHGLIAGRGWVTCRKTLRTVQTIYVAAGTLFNWTGRPGLGNSFMNGAARLKRVDSDWLRFIGAGGTFNGYSGSPDATDAILPLGTQRYPGATRQRDLLFANGFNISHQEANDAVTPVLDAYKDVLVNNLGVLARGGGGGGDGGGGGGGCTDPTAIIC